jgi:flagellar biosynthesis component FlhA
MSAQTGRGSPERKVLVIQTLAMGTAARTQNRPRSCLRFSNCLSVVVSRTETPIVPVAAPMLLCHSPARFHSRRLLEPFVPRIVVLSSAEIPPVVSVQSMGMVQ